MSSHSSSSADPAMLRAFTRARQDAYPTTQRLLDEYVAALAAFKASDPDFAIDTVDPADIQAFLNSSGGLDTFVNSVATAFERADWADHYCGSVKWVDDSALKGVGYPSADAQNNAIAQAQDDADRVAADLALAKEAELFNDHDGSKKGLLQALTDVDSNAAYPQFQKAFLEKLGPQEFAELESYLDENNQPLQHEIVMTALSQASLNGLPDSWMHDFVNAASLGQLARVSGVPLSNEFDTAVVLSALNLAVASSNGKYPYDGAAPPELGTVLENVARNYPAIARSLLMDPSFNLVEVMRMSNFDPQVAKGVAALLTTGLAAPEGAADTPTILKRISGVLADHPGAVRFDGLGSPDGSPDKELSQQVADALAKIYSDNSGLFYTANQQQGNASVFNEADVYAFLKPMIEWPSSYQAAREATAREINRQLDKGARFGADGSPPSHFKDVCDDVGGFANTFAAAELSVHKSEAARKDAQHAFAAALLTDAVSLIPVGKVVGIAVHEGEKYATGATDPHYQDKVHSQVSFEPANWELQSNRAVFTAYYNNASSSYAFSPQAREFVDATTAYNKTFSGDNQFLDQDGHVKTDLNADAANNLNLLIRGGLEGVPYAVGIAIGDSRSRLSVVMGHQNGNSR